MPKLKPSRDIQPVTAFRANAAQLRPVNQLS